MNNIALVKLRKDVKLGKFVQTVCLPEDNEGDLAMTKSHGIQAANCWGDSKYSDGIPEWADRVTNRLQDYDFLIQNHRLCSNGTAISFDSTESFSVQGTREEEITLVMVTVGAFSYRKEKGEMAIDGLAYWCC